MYTVGIHFFHLSHAGSIAECIKQKLPYADVRGVDTEDDIVSALSSVPPPITLEKKEFEGLGLPINQSLGCFIRGAGTMYVYEHLLCTCMHYLI